MAKRRNSDKIIPEPQLPKDITIKFSFRCYDDTGRYCLSKWEKDDVSLALQRLKEINCKTYNELHQSRFAFSFHPVNWATTTEKDGYSDNFLKDMEPFQIAILGVNNQKARMYGALKENTFYIVWFDLEHKITPSALKHT